MQPGPKPRSFWLLSSFVVVPHAHPAVASFREDGFCPADLIPGDRAELCLKRKSQDFILEMALDRGKQLNCYWKLKQLIQKLILSSFLSKVIASGHRITWSFGIGTSRDMLWEVQALSQSLLSLGVTSEHSFLLCVGDRKDRRYILGAGKHLSLYTHYI